MTVHNYLLFVGASTVLVLVPGPDMIYMLGRCIAQGRKAGLMAAIGFNLGGYVHLAAAVLGLSAVLATSAVAFGVVKWLGAIYLVYLGITALANTGRPIELDTQTISANDSKAILRQAFLSDVLNPKVAMFFMALPAAVRRRSPLAPNAADTFSWSHRQRNCARRKYCPSGAFGVNHQGIAPQSLGCRMASQSDGRDICGARSAAGG
jgi:threonine/homoserine/homoserine lactone efflux protein